VAKRSAYDRSLLEAECAKPEHEKKKWVIEKSGGLENPAPAVRLLELCRSLIRTRQGSVLTPC
jgi:hypothetical protein